MPAHWPLEVINGLLMAVRRGRISEEKALRFVCDLDSLPITIDSESNLSACSGVMSLAQQHRLTAYDAAYLEVALRSGLPLASLDGELRTAAAAAAIPLV